MRLLLDTHCWLWLHTAPDRFGPGTLALLSNANNEILLSAASSWEIAIKYALGKLPLPAAPSTYVPSRMAASGTTPLVVEHSHALRVAELPAHHNDPFDRLIIAQAQLESLDVLTADPMFSRYDVQLVSV